MGIAARLTDDLRILSECLQQCSIRYALAGGLAYSALVRPRATMDIDMLTMLPDIQSQKFFNLLKERFLTLFIHSSSMKFRTMKIRRAVSIRDGQEMIFDFLLAESEFHDQALERAIETEFLGTKLKIVTPEDLILLKKCAARPQDMVDIDNIYNAFRNEIDLEYIALWERKLELNV